MTRPGAWHRAVNLALITGRREDLAPLVLAGPTCVSADGSAFASYRQALHDYLRGEDPEPATDQALLDCAKAQNHAFLPPRQSCSSSSSKVTRRRSTLRPSSTPSKPTATTTASPTAPPTATPRSTSTWPWSAPAAGAARRWCSAPPYLQARILEAAEAVARCPASGRRSPLLHDLEAFVGGVLLTAELQEPDRFFFGLMWPRRPCPRG
ncbi:hypothetical protein SALBM311S_10656 [Streptomyces alboniger]